MALVRFEPVRELNSLQHEMNRLFNTFFDAPRGAGTNGAGTNGGGQRWLPATDLVETDDHFVLRVDLPGLSEEDVTIELEDNVLTISGEREPASETRQDGFYRLERAVGQFSRSMTLPEGVDGDQIAAEFDRGVLEVRIPKPEERKPRRVSIGVGAKQNTIEGSEA